MAKGNPPRPGARPPRPGARSGGKKARPGGASRSGKRPSAKPPSAKPPKAEGGSFSPPKAAPPEPAAPPSDSGSDLRMVPLTEADAEDMEVGQPKSATQFFSIPQPKRKSKPMETPPPASASGPSANAGPPPGTAPPGGGSMAPGMGMGMGIIGIQGPVAGAPPSMAPQMHSQGAGLHGQPPADGNRAQSYRVFAILAGLMMMVFMALVVTVMLTVAGVYWTNQTEPVAKVPVTAPPPTRRSKAVDTGQPAPPIPTPPIKSPTRPSGGGGTPKPKTPAPPAPPAPAAAGTVTVLIPPDASFTSIEVSCSGTDFRNRASFSGGKATLADVPAVECDLKFKGGLPAANKIQGGQTKSCTFPGGQAVCQ
jgi:hypothetical protein